MNDGVEGAKLIGACCDGFCLRDTAEVAVDGGFGSWCGGEGVICALGIASVEDDVVALRHEELSGHFAEAVGGAGNEDFGHGAKLGKWLEIPEMK